MIPQNIELNKIVSCTPSNIKHYTYTLFPALIDISPVLRFTANETMLQPTIAQKVSVPVGKQISFVHCIKFINQASFRFNGISNEWRSCVCQ